MQDWRIALKPGRPLALGLWKGVPVFGLPGIIFMLTNKKLVLTAADCVTP